MHVVFEPLFMLIVLPVPFLLHCCMKYLRKHAWWDTVYITWGTLDLAHLNEIQTFLNYDCSFPH